MSKDEIIDKIETMAYSGVEFEAVYVSIERLKAVIACLKSYCEDVEYAASQDGIYIAAVLTVAEEIASKVDSRVTATADAIISLTTLSTQTKQERAADNEKN